MSKDQMSEANTDANQNVDLKKEVSTETNHIKKSKFGIGTDSGSNLSKKDKEKKRVDELLEIYKPSPIFFSIRSRFLFSRIITSSRTEVTFGHT